MKKLYGLSIIVVLFVVFGIVESAKAQVLPAACTLTKSLNNTSNLEGNEGIQINQISTTALSYTIDISCTSAQDLSLITFTDVVPAEFDLDPAAEDAASVIVGCTDGTCDGVDFSDGDIATSSLSKTPGAGKGNPNKLDIEIITFTLDNSVTAVTIEVFTKTDANPGNVKANRADIWEPTSEACLFYNDGVIADDGITTEGPLGTLARVACDAAVNTDGADGDNCADDDIDQSGAGGCNNEGECLAGFDPFVSGLSNDPQCDDGVDNEGTPDGFTDHPADAQCSSPCDNDESS